MASDLTRSEVQVLRLASTDTSDTLSGNFRLSWGDGGEETDYLPFDVGEVELEAALEALQEIRDVQVRRIRAEDHSATLFLFAPAEMADVHTLRSPFHASSLFQIESIAPETDLQEGTRPPTLLSPLSNPRVKFFNSLDRFPAKIPPQATIGRFLS